MSAVIPTESHSPETTWPERAVAQLGIADTYVVVGWKAAISGTPITGYLVREVSGRYARVVEGGLTHLLIDGLEPGTRYQILIAARAGGTWCSPSARTWVRTSGVSTSALRAWEHRSFREHDGQWDPVADLLARTSTFPVLTRDEEIELGKEIDAEGSDGHGAAFWRFAMSNIRLVIHLARRSMRRVKGTILDFEDLVQVGFEGLLQAVERWDWRKGYKFSTYGTWWIRQKIDREIANLGRTVRIPVHLVDEINRVTKALRSLGDDVGGSEVAYAEVAQMFGLSMDRVRYLLGLIPPPLPLNEIALSMERDEKMFDTDLLGDDAWLVEALEGFATDGPQLGDLLDDAAADGWLRASLFVDPATEDVWDHIDETLGISSAIAEWRRLPDRERRIMDLRYGLTDGNSRTLEEIGQTFGLTRERIRQIEGLALAKLRHPSCSRDLESLL